MVLRRPPESRLDRTLARRSGEKARGNPGPQGSCWTDGRHMEEAGQTAMCPEGARAGDAVEGIAWVQGKALLTPIQADCILLWGSPGLGPGFPDWPSSSSPPGSGPSRGTTAYPEASAPPALPWAEQHLAVTLLCRPRARAAGCPLPARPGRGRWSWDFVEKGKQRPLVKREPGLTPPGQRAGGEAPGAHRGTRLSAGQGSHRKGPL